MIKFSRENLQKVMGETQVIQDMGNEYKSRWTMGMVPSLNKLCAGDKRENEVSNLFL